ncbi:MAG: tetratricopeptide repeat protein [Deltaproteobacteria bacterium]|nr:tetratricopeptide repeat protein [Deltaproteobacteria bacterium]
MPRYKSLPKTKVKETNEFVSAVDHAVHFLVEYKKTFLVALLVFALGGLGWLIFQQKRENDLQDLNKLVFKAVGEKEGQVEAFQKILQKYGRYPLAQTARFFLVDAYLKEAENEKALEELTKASEKAPSLLSPYLKLGRAELLWQTGKREEALEYIDSVEREPAGVLSGYFLLLKGQILESLGKKEEAKEVYQGLLESTTDDPFLLKKVRIRLVQIVSSSS